MKQRITFAALLTIFCVGITSLSCNRKQDLKALVITGQNMNWKRNIIALSAILRKTKIFDVEVKISPAAGEDMSGFIVDFTPYDVVVLDYAGDKWPEETRNNFVSYVSNGGGVVVYHADNNAFPDWPEYNRMIGVGGFGNRDEKSGPYIYVRDGKVIRDYTPGKAGSHGYIHEYVVHALKPHHPILKGLPENWMHVQDELYDRLRGPAENMEVLAYAHSDTAMLGTGRDEPVIMTINYGKGRIFHTTLGHTWEELFSPPLECAGFITIFQRGAEWAATGKVIQKTPENFPTETKSLRWFYFEDISEGARPLVKRMQEYEPGKSTDCFTIFGEMIKEDINNPGKMREYNEIIKDILESEKATAECRKVLLRDFAWMADDSMKEVFEKLRADSLLSGEAEYALQVISTR
jgi:type 1 glutamine amidotransferase